MLPFLAYTVIAILTPFNVAYSTARYIFGFYKALIERFCLNLINGPRGIRTISIINMMINILISIINFRAPKVG